MKNVLIVFFAILSFNVFYNIPIEASGGCSNAMVYSHGTPYCSGECSLFNKNPGHYQKLYLKKNCVRANGTYYHDLYTETKKLGCC